MPENTAGARGELVALLAPTLGAERATELVAEATVALNMAGEPLSPSDAVHVLRFLGGKRGFVGSVARFALVRFSLQEARHEPSTSPSATPATPAVPEPKRVALGRAEMVDLLAQSLGREKSDEVIQECLDALGFPADAVALSQGLAVFDRIAELPGLVGVAARFAKASLLMRSKS
jgi:hypothetical protein